MIFGSWTYDMANVNVKGFNFGGSGDSTITIDNFKGSKVNIDL